MGVELIYKHQQKTHELMERELEESGRAAYVFPVGCGKSFPVLKYIEDNPEKKILYVSPSIGIIHQMERYIATYIDISGKNVHRIVRERMPNFRAITYQKIGLTEDISDIKPDIIIFDEIHRMGAEEWEKGIDRIIEANPEAQIIGMSATPERADKRNMAYEKFGKIIYEMSLTEALSGEKEGEVVLNGAKYFRVISQLKEEIKEYGEWIETIEDEGRRQRLQNRYERLEGIVSKSPDIAEVMEQGMSKKNGKYLIFCTDREEMFEKMEHAEEIFGRVNKKIKKDYVITKTREEGVDEEKRGKTQAENRKTIEEFEQREEGEELQLLFCVDMLNEGIHIKGIAGEVQFRPTESERVYKQQIGRTLTSEKDAEETVIIDAVNNWLRQIDIFEELRGAVQRGDRLKNDKEKHTYDLLKLSAEEEELLNILIEIGEEYRYSNARTYEEIIEWIDTHEGKMPRVKIKKDGEQLKRSEMTQEERDEVNLYGRWFKSPERAALEACKGIPIEELPEKYQEYKEQISEVRKRGYGLLEKTTYEEIIEWLDTHEGKMPRSAIIKDGRVLKREEMTQEENEEVRLYNRWNCSPEKVALEACKGIPIEELPEEYQKYKEQIAELRKRKKTTYEEIIEWLDTHEGKMPRTAIYRDGRELKREEMTQEENEEVRLYARWYYSPERAALEACKGIPIEELPEEYQKYKEQIIELRKRKKTTYEEIIEWLDTHEGKMPRSTIIKDGRKPKREEMTQEENEEVRLYNRWNCSPEKAALKACKGIPIEELPEEYQKYKEQIAELRRYEQIRKDAKIKQKMRQSVGKHVDDNSTVRQELEQMAKKTEIQPGIGENE